MGIIIASNRIPPKIKTMFKRLLSENSKGELFLHGHSQTLPDKTAFHTDLSFFAFDDGCIIVSPEFYINFMEKFSQKEFDIKCGKTVGSKYPYDIAYNAAIVGNNLFCHEKYTEIKILEQANKRKMNIIDITQGYAKCSMVIIGSNAIITADSQIHDVAQKNGIDSLLTSNDGVALNGYDNGFIGGASIKIRNNICFTGDISAHKDYDRIAKFCKLHNVEPVYEKDEALYDYGSPIYLNDL